MSIVTLLIGIQTLFMVLTALFMSLGHASWVDILCYSSSGVWQGQVLRLVTYAFVNPPSIWFALEMMMLYYFGREVERLLGSKKFTMLYLGLTLLGSSLLQLLSLRGISEQMSGAQSIHFAIFAAFVAIYPGLPFLFGVAARWMLLGLLTLSILQFLEARQFTSMMIFLTESLGAILFMMAQGYWGLLPDRFRSFLSMVLQRLPLLRQRQQASVSASKSSLGGTPSVPLNASSGRSLIGACSTTTSFVPVFTNQATSEKRATTPLPAIIDIDAVLEKISQTGMESLTARERELLEKASSALVERDTLLRRS
ncbi:MAG: rhomboid family intramembrane serine protease [Chthoniobacterales bacterium]